MSLHRLRVHPEYVPTCFGCRVGTIQVGRSTHGQEAQTEFQRDFAAEFHNGDREAYRRLRQNGLQPPSIRGSAHLEQHAETAFEVATGRIFPDRKLLAEATRVAADAGMDLMAPATTPSGS